jgi:hypothetical protein
MVRINARMEHLQHIWPTIRDIADDLGLPYTTVHSWAGRGNIPACYDADLIEAAARRGSALTLEDLAIHRRPKKRRGGAL